MNKNIPIILASGSKARSQILTSCGIPHTVIVSNVPELHPTKKRLVSSVIKNAERKVRAAAKELHNSFGPAIVIGADTLVTFGNEVIGKPKDEREAKNILKNFSGSTIDVYTGLFVLNTKTGITSYGYEKSSVRVKKIAPQEINKYFEKLGPYDKAGGFSIEGVGSFIFDDINGSYFNIIGIPMGKLKELCAIVDIDLLDYCG